jgi:phytoene dehydrogenase-like protein
LDGGWEERREELVDLFVETINEYAPGFRETVLARQVLTPVDLENRFGLTEGNIYHGQMDLDQLLFMRPVPGYARYRTPVERLYLCGAGTHPGGGVTGAPGYNAAREIEKDLVMRS